MEISMAAIAAMSALSLPLGAVLGAVYDVIRLLRVIVGVDVGNPFKKKRRLAWLRYIIVIISDLAFFIIASFAMCVFFFLTGDGRMRGLALAFAFCGFMLYYNTVGRLIIGMAESIRRLVFRMLAFILRLFKKLGEKICNLPIVSRAFTRYNDYINKRKKKAAKKKRRRRMKKCEHFKN